MQMTNEEAVKTIEVNRAMFDAVIEALEKQIPKRPKYKAEDRFVKNHFNEYSYCPVCEKDIFAGDMFCVMCGQAIDWGG